MFLYTLLCPLFVHPTLGAKGFAKLFITHPTPPWPTLLMTQYSTVIHWETSTKVALAVLVHYQYTSIPVYQYTSTPVHQYNSIPVHQYKYTSTPVHQATQ